MQNEKTWKVRQFVENTIAIVPRREVESKKAGVEKKGLIRS